ncbi:selenocysteine-specific translation elongation factor [Calderihabitans maritimus]|uniref:Selenocysteine-specific elongation factor n=1 Tax=Calderihabitans maritimus TaxID=1246530 RepID=A0A1Z5HVU3_9FIRM|nr:selenocysteine-specific translation elongation factor [Calderihabitans maritimus]GAW93669.1 selenocysteine-specific translation elongation factor SelB [Calderihabitans maritimus]
MDYIIVGTAGHIDHGKTVLVKALTGVDTDRLKEEKERGISIELGFAPLVLSNGLKLGLVDVPGHERFIKQMLAGVGGIDLVLLVVAADEGVMPQTQEHLDIIDLLQIKRGIIVITKKDLVDDEWLELVQEEVRETVRGTVLEHSPMVAVSALTGEGISELRRLLEELAETTPPKSSEGYVRLPIDRVFSVTGFGTVVTGTLWSGSIRTGDELEILPHGLRSRVRNLQIHGETVSSALAGQRVAVNLAGLEVHQVERGDVLATPGVWQPSYRMDVKLHLLNRMEKPLQHRARVRVHLGTSEILGRVVLLDRDELLPGETAYAQMVMEKPVVAAKNDRFVIRNYSPMYTLGGGTVVEPVAAKHKRFRPEIIKALDTKLTGTPAELVLQAVKSHSVPLIELQEVAKKVGMLKDEVLKAANKLKDKNLIQIISGETETFLVDAQQLKIWEKDALELLEDYHSRFSLREGIPKEELRSRQFALLSAKAFNLLLQHWAQQGIIRIKGNFVAKSDFQCIPDPKQRRILNQIEQIFKENLFQPPSLAHIQDRIGITGEQLEELLRYLLRTDKLVKVSEDLFFHADAVKVAQEKIGNYLSKHEQISLGEARDLLESSRKFVLPLLEYFDQVRFTRRVGDIRVLYSKNQG